MEYACYENYIFISATSFKNPLTFFPVYLRIANQIEKMKKMAVKSVVISLEPEPPCFYKISLTAFNFFMSLSNETTTFSGEEWAARIQSTISILVLLYFRSASRSSDLSGFTMPEKFRMPLNFVEISFLGI